MENKRIHKADIALLVVVLIVALVGIWNALGT
jgi:hypothetical protein